ncbi:glucuronate isomerase [uncultured Polaribacter sp.]|uniref:glucuronate isomerase n=1 Tax=uncultured Polaribacter sp. TaxID=174711 RepID=UPI00262D16B2|nr:glucuronate isomerase [uncultured Polaribacter sp.]
MNTTHFITDTFLLQSEIAETLYSKYAKDLPIIDYHNHLSPQMIAEDKPIKNITDAWLNGDHYKWRGMRANGIDENFITGKETSKKDKFLKWAETVPFTIRNPLFHWTHLELKRYFNIDEILKPSTAEDIYEKTNSILEHKTPAQLLAQMKVEVICTTDDPIDSLEYHKIIAEKDFFTKVLPTFRPDNLLLIEANNFISYIQKLSAKVQFSILNLADLLKAIQNRIDFFNDLGCRISDYGLEQIFSEDFTQEAADAVFKKRLANCKLSKEEAKLFSSCILYNLCKMYDSKNWVQQFHLGALRNNNSKLLDQIGLDAGVDSIGDFNHAENMSKLFNKLDSENSLAKTITYNLNPSQNEVFATMMGNFNQGGVPGKMQWGSGWWFLDQKEGMEKQLNALSSMGLLSRFVGMLTDSRSFLSFTRHEYFRRILCNLIAEDVKNGLIPNDLDFLGKIIQDICYYNAINYFNFKK